MKYEINFFNRYINGFFIHERTHLLFGVLLLLITFILPYSGNGEEGQHEWSDQSLFLKSLQEALAGKSPVNVDSGLIGPGYVALGVVITKILGINPASALVVLNRLCFLSTVLVFFSISHLLLHKTFKKPKTQLGKLNSNKINFLSSIIAFTYSLTLVLSSIFVSFSDIPWTHFPATLLLLICILSILKIEEYNKQNLIHYAWLIIFGSAFGLLIQVRFFEGFIFFVSLVIWIALLITRKNNIKYALVFLVKTLPLIASFFIITSYLTLVLSHSKSFHMLYFSLAKHNPYVREFTKLYIEDLPLKFVQLFVDTNFLTINQSYDLKPIIFGFSLSSWRMPLLLQVPALIYILPSVVILLFIIFKQNVLLLLTAEIFLPVLVGAGLILGYVSSAASGSPHLKYGFVRDFMAPTWSLALVTGPWSFYRYVRPTIFSKRMFLVGVPIVPILVCILYGQIIIQATHFLQFKIYHVQNINFSHSCKGLECSIKVKMYNFKGQVIEVPQQHYIINGVCPSTGEQTAVTLSSQNQTFKLPSCVESYPVNVFPVDMGFASTPEVPISWSFKPIQPTSSNVK